MRKLPGTRVPGTPFTDTSRVRVREHCERDRVGLIVMRVQAVVGKRVARLVVARSYCAPAVPPQFACCSAVLDTEAPV